MDRICEMLRKRIVDVENKKVKLTKFNDLNECMDNNCYVNCMGMGRLRRYKNFSLFLDNQEKPQKRLLRGLNPSINDFETQVFQIMGCNMRCWYCFVDRCVLAAREGYGEWMTISDMIELFLKENHLPYIIDLSGGQPDLVPEWCLWVMEEVEKRNLRDIIYIWMDDNLATTHIMEKYLTQEQISYMANYPKHSRACCFKGYNEYTYRFNVGNKCLTLEEQVNNFRKLYNYGFDIYAYITLTGPKGSANRKDIEVFISKIQDIHPKLPLRLIPIKIKEFTETAERINGIQIEALEEQYRAYDIWTEVMNERFSKEEMNLPYENVIIQNREF